MKMISKGSDSSKVFTVLSFTIGHCPVDLDPQQYEFIRKFTLGMTGTLVINGRTVLISDSSVPGHHTPLCIS